jgi:circadian clock protein KaiC
MAGPTLRSSPPPFHSYVSTGITGLDDILGGGFSKQGLFVIEGLPGSGKTTLALQFLLAGAQRGERVLCVSLSETAAELHGAAASHGWSLDGVTIREAMPSQDSLKPDEQYTMFHPSEVELSQTTQTLLDEVVKLRPTRVVFDSLSEFRMLAANPLRYRRQILAMKQFFSSQNSTVLLLDDMSGAGNDQQVQSIARGVVRLEQILPRYGGERRRLIVLKFRGVAYRGGYHDYVIRRGGLDVFPRLVANEHAETTSMPRLHSGIGALDDLLGGGIEAGTSTLIIGAAGTGKSSIAARFVATTAERGQNAAMFMFDESVRTLLSRCDGLGIPLKKHVDAGRVALHPIDPAELSPGEFVHRIRQAVARDRAAVIVIDSLNGYLMAMPEEHFLVVQLHELLSFLGQAGVATILIGAHHGLIGTQMVAPVDASYLADAVLLLRYYELRGEVRQAISVVKKRGGEHERTIRDLRMRSGSIDVGAPLREFRGVLTGVPSIETAPDAHGPVDRGRPA